MASVRTSAIKNQRATSQNLLKFSRGIRVLSISTKTDSIAANVQAGEDKDVTNRYADGLISNADYLTYLNGILGRSGLSTADRAQVSNSIRDTQDKIGVESAQATYDSQADNTIEKANAAKAIADYWKVKAENSVPGTPAYSSAAGNYGTWMNKYQTLYTAANRAERLTKRAASELEISMMDGSTSEKTVAKSNMYAQLAQDALTDGDSAEATRLQTLSNNTYTQAEAQFSTEGNKSNRLDLANLKNMWHDGTISAEDLNVAVNELNDRAINAEDESLQLAINGFTDQVSKDIDKGLKRGEWGGLPVVKGRGGAAGLTSILDPKTNMTWEEQDTSYTDQMMNLDWLIKSGQINAEDGRGQQIVLMMERASVINDRVQKLGAMSEGTKIPYNGVKSSAENIRNDFVTEYMGDASKPFMMKGLAPEFLKGTGIQPIMQGDVPQLVAAKYQQLVASGVDTANLTPQEVYDQLNLDLQGKTGVAYIQKHDENNQPYYDIVSTQNNPKFIPGTTHLFDGYIWHDIQTGNLSFQTKEAASAYFQSIFSRVPTDNEMKQNDNGSFDLSLPAHAIIDGQAWVQAQGGGWKPADPAMSAEYDQVNALNMPDNPITAENKGFTVLRADALNQLKSKIQTVRGQTEIQRINQAEQNNPIEQQRVIAGENLKSTGMNPSSAIVSSNGQLTDMTGRVLSQREVYEMKNPSLTNEGLKLKTAMDNVNPALKNIITLPAVPGGGKTQSYQSPLGFEQKPSDEFVNAIAKSPIVKPVPINIPAGTQIYPQNNNIPAFQPSSAPNTPGLSSININRSSPVSLPSTIKLGPTNISGLNSNIYSGYSQQSTPAPTQQAKKPSLLSTFSQWLQPTLGKIKSWFGG